MSREIDTQARVIEELESEVDQYDSWFRRVEEERDKYRRRQPKRHTGNRSRVLPRGRLRQLRQIACPADLAALARGPGSAAADPSRTGLRDGHAPQAIRVLVLEMGAAPVPEEPPGHIYRAMA